MSTSPNRFVVAALAAFALVAGAAALPAEAKKAPQFKPVFVAKLPGEPKGVNSFKAIVKGEIGKGTGFSYTDGVGALTINGVATHGTNIVTFNVNVFGGFDLTNVTFPVTAPCLLVYSWSKTTFNPKDILHPKTKAYTYDTAPVNGATVTITSYDPVKNEMTGTLQGDVEFHENIQDPKDDARDGTIVHLKGAKFALKPIGG